MTIALTLHSFLLLQHKADVQRLKQENGELVRMAEELMCSLEKERQKNRVANKA